MDFNYLKRRSIFDNSGNQPGQYPPFDFKSAAESQNQDVTDPSNKLASQSTSPISRFSSTYADLADEKGGPAFQKYNEFLNSNQPNRDDYKPGKLDRIAAILAGASEGVRHGAGAAVDTTHRILDDKYNEAMGDYSLQGKKLESAAGIEEKDMGRRVGILKDIIQQDHLNKQDTETETYHKGLVENGRERNKRTGLHYDTTIDPKTGLKKVSVIGPDASVIGNIDAGQGGSSLKDRVDESTQKYDATVPNRIKVAAAGAAARGAEARKTQDNKFSNLQEFLQWKQDNGIGSKYVGHYNKQGKLIFVNNMDSTDFHVAPDELSHLSDADKQKAKIELKAAPGPAKPDVSKETNLTRDSNGRVIKSETTTKTDNNSKEQTKPIPGNDKMEAVSVDGGKTWKARKKS